MEEEQKRHYNKNSYFEKINFQEGNGMKKKRLAMALAVAVTIAALSGCGTKEEQKTGEKAPATEEAPEADTGKAADEAAAAGSGDAVNLKVYSWHAERADLYEEIFSEFNKLYPNITATYITYDDDQYYSMLSTAIQTGDAPDLFATSGTKKVVFGNYVDMGACMPLDDLFDFSQWPDELMRWGQVDGVTYMTPSALGDAYGVYYNKDIFDKYGLTEPETWDELIEICDTLVANGVTPFALSGLDANGIQWWFNTMMTSYSPEWNTAFPYDGNDFTHATFKEMLQVLADFRDAGYFGKDYESMDTNGAYLYFSSGKAAMMADGSWQAYTYSAMNDVNMDVFLWPTRDGRRPTYNATATEVGFSIYSGTEHKDEAVLLAEYCMTYEPMQKILDLGNNVPIMGIEGLENLKSPDRLMNKFGTGDFIVSGFVDRDALLAKEGYDAFGLLNECLQSVLFGQKTVDEAAAAMQDMLDMSLIE